MLRFFEVYPHDWARIARLIPGKSAAEVKERYFTALKGESTVGVAGEVMEEDVEVREREDISNDVTSLVDPMADFFRKRVMEGMRTPSTMEK